MYGTLDDILLERPEAGAAVVTFTGEHDLLTRDDLGTLLDSLVEENDLVVADFSEATFVDSTILHVLLNADMAARRRGRIFRVQLGTASIVRTAFELSGVLTWLDCALSREAALRNGSPSRRELGVAKGSDD